MFQHVKFIFFLYIPPSSRSSAPAAALLSSPWTATPTWMPQKVTNIGGKWAYLCFHCLGHRWWRLLEEFDRRRRSRLVVRIHRIYIFSLRLFCDVGSPADLWSIHCRLPEALHLKHAWNQGMYAQPPDASRGGHGWKKHGFMCISTYQWVYCKVQSTGTFEWYPATSRWRCCKEYNQPLGANVKFI